MLSGALLYLTAFMGQMIFFEYQRRSFKFDADQAPLVPHWIARGAFIPISVPRATHPRFEIVSVP